MRGGALEEVCMPSWKQTRKDGCVDEGLHATTEVKDGGGIDADPGENLHAAMETGDEGGTLAEVFMFACHSTNKGHRMGALMKICIPPQKQRRRAGLTKICIPPSRQRMREGGLTKICMPLWKQRTEVVLR